MVAEMERSATQVCCSFCRCESDRCKIPWCQTSRGVRSRTVRLFANMLAGHITLYVFGTFVTMVGAVGIVIGATIPLAMTVALVALNCWSPSSRRTYSPFLCAFISTMRFTLDIDPLSVVPVAPELPPVKRISGLHVLALRDQNIDLP